MIEGYALVRSGVRTESHKFAGVQVDVHFPEFGVDHSRYAGQVVTVIVPGHEGRPLRYVVGRSRLPEGVEPDSAEGQDVALKLSTSQVEDDVKAVLAGKEVPAQKMDLWCLGR